MSLLVLDLLMSFLETSDDPRAKFVMFQIFHSAPVHVVHHLRFFSWSKYFLLNSNKFCSFQHIASLWCFSHKIWTATTSLICREQRLFLTNTEEPNYVTLPIEVSACPQPLPRQDLELSRSILDIYGPKDMILSICKLMRENNKFIVSRDDGFGVTIMGFCVPIIMLLQQHFGMNLFSCSSHLICLDTRKAPQVGGVPWWAAEPIPLQAMVSPMLWWIPCRRFLRPVLTIPGWFEDNEHWTPWFDFSARVHNMLVRCDFLSVYQRHMNLSSFESILDRLGNSSPPPGEEQNSLMEKSLNTCNIGLAFRLVAAWARTQPREAYREHLISPMIRSDDPKIRHYVFYRILHGKQPPPDQLPSSISVHKSSVWYTAAQAVVNRHKKVYGLIGHPLSETLKLFHLMVAY